MEKLKKTPPISFLMQDKLKKETEAQIKQLSDQVTAATDNTNELKKQLQEAIKRIEVLEGKTTS